MPNSTKSYDILIGGKLYKTVTNTGGYNFSQITQELHGLAKQGLLTGFDLTKGVVVKASTGSSGSHKSEKDD